MSCPSTSAPSSCRLRGCLHLALLLVICIFLQTPTTIEAQQNTHQSSRHARAKKTVLSAEERPSCQIGATPQGPGGNHASRQVPHLDQNGSSNANSRESLANTSSQLESSQSLLTSAQQQQQQQPAITKQPSPATSTHKVDTSERLRQLRQLLVSNNYDAYLVTPNDEHGSEYVSDFDRRLRFISGFSGSNGYALVTLDRAVLFTDGRYALQAELDLDCNWSLVVSDNPLLEVPNWIKSRSGGRRTHRLATDARLMSLQVFDYLDSELKRHDSTFEFALISLDLIDVVWNNLEEHQRSKPSNPLTIHQLEYTGQTSWQEKVLKLADLMARSRARYYVISKLDDIAWLLNLRGSDIPMAPLFKAYVLLSRQPATSGPKGAASGRRFPGEPATAAAANRVGSSASQPPILSQQGATTSPSVQLSLEQLLASANGNQLQLQQQQQQNTEGDLPSLQSPQVVQVPASQLIRVTLYVDLRKVTPEVREHLRLDTASQQQQQQQSSTVNGSTPTMAPLSGAEHFGNIESRIQVELKDYDVFIMDFGERFRLQAAANQPPYASQQQLPDTITGADPASMAGGKLLLDAMANVAIHVLAKHYDDRLILMEPLCQRLKSVKNELEVMGMRQAHWRDSLAIAMLLGQLEHDIGVRKRTDKWTEVGAANELEFYRSLMDLNKGQSFHTISAYGPNGAIIHYIPDPSSDREQVRIGNQSTYLLDSGGQYLDGTTDITRTVHFGRPSDFQRETYTRVLMGAIDMMSLIFEQPLERSPHRLNDLLARRHLFDIGLSYEHGTGHGIGLYSLVHESPALIVSYDQVTTASAATSSAARSQNQSKLTASVSIQDEPLPIRENMFTSVEPGFYKANEFGIRLENIVVTQRMAWTSNSKQPISHLTSSSASSYNSNNDNRTTTTTEQNEPGTVPREWLRFEPISLVPFEPKLIKFDLLSNKQKAWLNSYNLMVRLRMTQQINYYLARVRQSQQQQQHQVHVLGTTSGSRLYRRLHEQQQQQQFSLTNSSSKEQQQQRSQEERENFRRMEPSRLIKLLEQAHRWIMSKTELIPLDVPQRLRGSNSNGNGSNELLNLDGRGRPSAATQSQSHGSSDNSSEWLADNNNQDQWSALGANPKGQRLMLAYMASLPFNDASAARALAASPPLTGRNQAPPEMADLDKDEQLTAAVKNQSSSSSNSGSDSLPSPLVMGTFGQKCAGIECDLLLLEALNSHQRQLTTASRSVGKQSGGSINNAHEQQQQLSTFDANREQQQQHYDHHQEKNNDRHQLLMDLFQIRPSSALPDAGGFWWSLVTNMWPILGLALIITLQLAVVLYVCGSGGGSGGASRRRGSVGGGNASTANGASRRQSLRSPSLSWVMNSGSTGRRRDSGSIDSVIPASVLQTEPTVVSLEHSAQLQQQQQQQQLPIVVTENI